MNVPHPVFVSRNYCQPSYVRCATSVDIYPDMRAVDQRRQTQPISTSVAVSVDFTYRSNQKFNFVCKLSMHIHVQYVHNLPVAWTCKCSMYQCWRVMCGTGEVHIRNMGLLETYRTLKHLS